jgi:hypothetical protein
MDNVQNYKSYFKRLGSKSLPHLWYISISYAFFMITFSVFSIYSHQNVLVIWTQAKTLHKNKFLIYKNTQTNLDLREYNSGVRLPLPTYKFWNVSSRKPCTW